MEAVAKLRNLKGSPKKMRLVVDMVRGMEVEKALNVLKFSSKKGAGSVEKLLLSAISNWENKNEGERADSSSLIVKSIAVDQGRVLKRWRPAARGSSHRIRKPYNHVTIVVDTKVEA